MSAREEIEQATREGALKRRLENTFLRVISPLFSSMASDYRISLASTGTLPNQPTMEYYRSSWQAALKKHYERVQRAFSGMVQTEQDVIKQAGNEDVSEDDLREALLIWAVMSSERSAKNIMDTNEKNMREALTEANEELRREGQPTDNRSVAALAVMILRRKLKARAGIIAMFETQQAAENAKFSEAEVLGGAKPSQIAGAPAVALLVEKVWRTMQDNRVRPSPLYPGQDPRFNHRVAEGQRRKIHEAFNVSGEKLMYPGDTSLGATVKNVIACRCASIYRVSEPPAFGRAV